MNFDELLSPVTTNVAPALAPYSALVASDATPSILSTPGPLMDLMHISHVKAVSRTARDFKTVFAAARPIVAVDAVKVKTIAAAIVEDDSYMPPDATDMDATLLPSILQLSMFFCKRAAMEHIACRIGSVPVTGEECKISFDPGMKKACNAHLTQLAQNIMSLLPFKSSIVQSSSAVPSNGPRVQVDEVVRDMDTHLKMCREEVVRYVTDAASQGPSQDPMAATFSVLGTSTQSAAIFGAVSEPSIADIVYHCFMPWFQLAFISTFVFQQKPLRFADVWVAQYIIHIFGYLFADDLARTVGLSDAQKAPFLQLKYGIATHMSLMAKVQSRLKDMYAQTLQSIQANMLTSKALFASGEQLDMRRQNMDAMGTNYLVARGNAISARRLFIASVIIYAVTTFVVTFLLVARRDLAPYALLVSGLTMLSIIIYALVRQIRSTKVT